MEHFFRSLKVEAISRDLYQTQDKMVCAVNNSLVGISKRNLKAVAEFINEFEGRYDYSDEFRCSGDGIGETLSDIPVQWVESVKLEVNSMAFRLVFIAADDSAGVV